MRQVVPGPDTIWRPGESLIRSTRAIDSWRDCDLLHVHMTAAEIAALLALRSWRVPVVSTRHFASRRGASRLGRLAAPAAAQRISAQIAISRYVADRIEGESTVVYPGVLQVNTTPDAGQRSRTVLLAQRLEAEKNTDLALRAFARSGVAADGWGMEIAGDGSQRPRLESLADDLGITQSVRFLGHRSDVPDLMQTAGILIATCEVEGLGLTVLEAMAAALPVVAVGAGGHLETVGIADYAALFDPGDVSEASRLIAQLALNPELRDHYGVALQVLQRNTFTLDAQARGTETVYRSVL